MAVCVVQGAGGVLQATTTALDACTDYILMDASTYTTLPNLTDIFVIPLVGDLQTMWMSGFALPVICYLSSWAFNSVINFAKSEK